MTNLLLVLIKASFSTMDTRRINGSAKLYSLNCRIGYIEAWSFYRAPLYFGLHSKLAPMSCPVSWNIVLYTKRLCVQSLAGTCTGGNLLRFFSYINVSLSLSLSLSLSPINKTYPWVRIKKKPGTQEKGQRNNLKCNIGCLQRSKVAYQISYFSLTEVVFYLKGYAPDH